MNKYRDMVRDIYLAFKFPDHHELPEQAQRWILAERYGYSLEYIDSIPEDDLAWESALQEALEKYRSAGRAETRISEEWLKNRKH